LSCIAEKRIYSTLIGIRLSPRLRTYWLITMCRCFRLVVLAVCLSLVALASPSSLRGRDAELRFDLKRGTYDIAENQSGKLLVKGAYAQVEKWSTNDGPAMWTKAQTNSARFKA